MKMKNENFRTLKIIPAIAFMASQRPDLKDFLFLVKTVQLGDKRCLDPLGGPITDGSHLGPGDDCRAKKAQLIFPSAGNMISFCWS